jgi:hypothetical protein
MILPQFKNASTLFEKEVAMFCQKHEETFDLESYHGRFHIIRCLMLADCIHRYYDSKLIPIAIDKSYFTILFHDIMREVDGVHLWELDSSNARLKFLLKNGYDNEFTFAASKINSKQNAKNFQEQVIFYVDALGYNRFFSLPNHRYLFEDYRQNFAGSNETYNFIDLAARKKIIRLAEDLVIYCETLPVSISTPDLVKLVLEYNLKIRPCRI